MQAATAVAGMGVNAGRQAAYERAQARQESQSGQTYNRTWVDYNDANQRQVRQDSIRQSAIENGKSVTITKDELSKLNKYFETDNTLSKADQAEARRKNKKIAIEVVKALLLEKFGKGNGVKFDIEGNTLVAYLYDEGIRHAVRRATPKKLAALQKADELFANATYLYSSKNDAHGKASNNERLDNGDYFYTPLTIEGDKTQTAGIRIAIKTYDNGDSNTYDMEMKKAEPLVNGARQALPARLPGGVYGSASTQSVAQQIAPVNGNGGESAVTDYNAMAVGATGNNPASVQTTAPARVTADITALKSVLENGGDAVDKICHENMSLAETVLDWVRTMISRVRGATMEAELRHIERLYRKGIAEAKKNTAQEGGTEYNIGKMETKNPPRDKRSPAESGGKPANAAPVVDSEHSVSQENVPVKDSTTRFFLSEENKSIADQLNDSLPEIMAMESVSEITIDERRVPYTGRKKADEKAALNVFRKQGLKAYREGLGKIELSRKGIDHSIFHGDSAAKQAAFAAVKDVIEHSKQVYEDQYHKGMGSDTYTFAAPVTFETEKIGMAVVVKQAGNGARP